MTLPELTDTQRAVLHAATQTQGRLEQFPRGLQGGARAKVVLALLLADLIVADGADHWLTDAGYHALGLAHPTQSSPTAPTTATTAVETPLVEDAQPAAEAHSPPAPRSRANSKQAMIRALLERPEGATLAQLCASTNWQKHTVRGTLSGVLKKRLGLELTSEKVDGERVYRLVGSTATP